MKPEDRLKEASKQVGIIVNGNQVRGDKMARARLLERCLTALTDDLREARDETDEAEVVE
jgi:hypothetical protein